jgi:hypothetical protein
MQNGDLAFIADQLRGVECLDKRLIEWLINQFDRLPFKSRLVIKKYKKRSRSQSELSPEEQLRIGEMVAREIQLYGKVYAIVEYAKENYGVSPSTAYRYYKEYLKSKPPVFSVK